MVDEDGSLKDTLEALESAKKLVSDLEYRVEQLSLGDYDTLKRIATHLHDAECTYNHTDGCSWLYEDRAQEVWFSDTHQRWVETARHRVMASGVSSGEFLEALQLLDRAKRSSRL